MADTTRKERASKPSVASHPLFPIVVVIWFAALFGLASLAIRPALIEGLVSATGIDQIVPMAAPPLGTTTRILIALMMTLLGCVIGAIVGRLLAKPAAKTVSTRRRRPAPPAQIEDVPSEVTLFGATPAEPVDEAKEDQPARRRRQLAINEAAESFDDDAPLPGSAQILSVAELPLKSFDEVDGIWLHSSDRVEPRPTAAAAAVTVAVAGDADRDDGAPLELGDEKHEAFEPSTPSTTAICDANGTDADGDADNRSNRLFETYVRRVNAGVSSNDPGIPAPGFVSVPVAEAEPAPQQHREAAVDPIEKPAADGHSDAATADAAYANTAERIATAPLDALSHVELLERLAQTIARRRREAARSIEVPAVSAPAEPVWFSAPQTVAAAGEMPAALRPHWMDAQSDDEDALPAIAPPRTMTMAPARPLKEPAAATTQDTGPLDEVTAAEDPRLLAEGYSSLLGMTKPGVRQVFGRSDVAEAAPVAAMSTSRAFDAPQTGEPLPDQTEQALRAALATLRRMSGAA